MYDFLHYRLDVESEILANMSGSVCGAVKSYRKNCIYQKGSTIMILAEILDRSTGKLRKKMRLIGTTLAFRWAA